MTNVKAMLVGEQISSNSKQALDLFSAQRFGEKVGEKIVYSLPEAMFLIEQKKMDIVDSKGKKLTEKVLMQKFEKIDKKFITRYIVFKDLRSRGYIVKTALKFGAEFRVYDKGKFVGEDHARWILFPVSEKQEMTWQDFSAKNRVAHSTKKKLLIAVVDEEGDVSYYESSWQRP
mgnify:CR=1 FL=1